MTKIEKALLDPASEFKSPSQVIQDNTLSRDQKIEILRRWEYDARKLDVAEEESMIGTNNNILDEILKALRELNADEDSKHFAPTKQGGV